MPTGLVGGLASPPVRPSRWHPASRRVFARWRALGTQPSVARRDWWDEVIVAPLAEGGYLAVCDLLVVPGRAHSAAAMAVNIASPASSVTFGGTAPTVTPDVGLVGDGVDDFLSTGLSIEIDYSDTLFKQNSGHLMARVSGLPGAAIGRLVGQSAGSTTFGLLRTAAGSLQVYLSAAGVDTGACGTSGVFLGNRRSSTLVRGHHDGSLLSEAASVSAAPAGARPIVGLRAGSSYTAATMGAMAMGAGLTDELEALVQSVMTAAWAESPPAA